MASHDEGRSRGLVPLRRHDRIIVSALRTAVVLKSIGNRMRWEFRMVKRRWSNSTKYEHRYIEIRPV
jgi:hypothetical protein